MNYSSPPYGSVSFIRPPRSSGNQVFHLNASPKQSKSRYKLVANIINGIRNLMNLIMKISNFNHSKLQGLGAYWCSPSCCCISTTVAAGSTLVVVGIALGVGLGVGLSINDDGSSTGWSLTGSMNSPRTGHTATVLSNGKVLAVGGTNITTFLNTADLYDPSTGTWTSTNNLNDIRFGHTASLLTNGKVLVVGGTNFGNTNISSAELYDPSTNIWTSIGSTNTLRQGHTATVLSDGKVLVVGGTQLQIYVFPTSSSELYDPSTGTFTSTNNMSYPSSGHTATMLSNGKVLVCGGFYVNTSTATIETSTRAELYDLSTGIWTLTGSMNTPRLGHTASLLSNGKVLVTGGTNSNLTIFYSSAELYDPSTGTWTMTGSMTNARVGHAVAVLTNGKVLVVGGYGANRDYYTTGEIYDPSTQIWSLTSNLKKARYGNTASILSNGKVLVCGGLGENNNTLNTAELYTY